MTLAADLRPALIIVPLITLVVVIVDGIIQGLRRR